MLTNNYSYRCVTRLLLFSLAAVLILSGCVPQASSSTSIAATSSTPIDSTAYPPFSYHYPETSSIQTITPEQMSPSVPNGLYAVTDKNDLTGIWFHMADPVAGSENNNMVYQFRFHDMNADSIMLSFGIYETDNGVFFRGEYTLDTDGVLTATLKLSDYEVPEDTPLIHITILAQKSDEAQNLCVFTIQSISTESEPFNNTFSSLLNVPVAYVFYPY